MQYHRHYQRGSVTTFRRNVGKEPRELTITQQLRNAVPRVPTKVVAYAREPGLRTGMVRTNPALKPARDWTWSRTRERVPVGTQARIRAARKDPRG